MGPVVDKHDAHGFTRCRERHSRRGQDFLTHHKTLVRALRTFHCERIAEQGLGSSIGGIDRLSGLEHLYNHIIIKDTFFGNKGIASLSF